MPYFNLKYSGFEMLHQDQFSKIWSQLCQYNWQVLSFHFDALLQIPSILYVPSWLSVRLLTTI